MPKGPRIADVHFGTETILLFEEEVVRTRSMRFLPCGVKVLEAGDGKTALDL